MFFFRFLEKSRFSVFFSRKTVSSCCFRVFRKKNRFFRFFSSKCFDFVFESGLKNIFCFDVGSKIEFRQKKLFFLRLLFLSNVSDLPAETPRATHTPLPPPCGGHPHPRKLSLGDVDAAWKGAQNGQPGTKNGKKNGTKKKADVSVMVQKLGRHVQ